MLWLIRFRDTKSDWLKLALPSPVNFIFLDLFDIYLFLVSSYRFIIHLMVVKLFKSWVRDFLERVACLGMSPQCTMSPARAQLRYVSRSLFLSRRLPARQFSLSLIARAIDWNNCRGDLQLLVGGIWRGQDKDLMFPNLTVTYLGCCETAWIFLEL